MRSEPNDTRTAVSSGPSIFGHVVVDIESRVRLFRNTSLAVLFAAVTNLPKAFASPQFSNGESESVYNLTAPDNTTANEIASEGKQESFSVAQWDQRGTTIRLGGTVETCLGNLSMALAQVTRTSAAEYNGAAGALSLLPTAGALIGAPTKELWVVTKLMPLAGLCSMLLSLGGSMVPSSVSEYDPSDTYTYEGMMSSSAAIQNRVNNTASKIGAAIADDDEKIDPLKQEIEARVSSFNEGGGTYTSIWYGLFGQAVFIAALIITLYYAQLGAVIVWWCQARYWMFYWYTIVALSSLLENFSGVPFTYQTTIRISKRPDNLRLAPNLTKVTPTSSDLEMDSTLTIDKLRHNRMNIRSYLELPKSYAWNRNCFYVILSVEEIKTWHATIRVFSKAFSVGVYAVGTATFASAQFVSITIALMTLTMVLGTAVLGRVLSLWMAKRLMSNNPIIHKIVKDDIEASRELDMIFGIPGLQVEVLGNVVVDGYAVHRRNEWFTIAKYIGVCAGPFNLETLQVPTRRTWFK